ncbi:amidohydrolase 2 [Rhodopirellula maiorica SM1]|uniref:Amidohydrolase 2 n=1 Tax=Rhodopirellula maiorica SM1 TaxID=1265738 RepID=M5RML7_9BACT|nr:amidohydrolase family protein [Rhodopirellula maiorica]EMI20550.1 amidohydrolase 2 [Rhodopirellula maiorica SM1]
MNANESLPFFDFNVHLPTTGDEGTQQLIDQERTMSAEAYAARIQEFHNSCVPQCRGANFMIFNESLIRDLSALEFLGKAASQTKNESSLTLLLDFRSEQALKAVESIRDYGFFGIKFHAYVQQITDADHPRIQELSKRAQQNGLSILIDTSFGGPDMYRCDNLKLSIAICNVVDRSPVILLHSGGARVLEAMLLAETYPNVYLDTSFSLNYYEHSSVEKDMAFAYRKIGTHRVLYGSDQPYVSSQEAHAATSRFIERFDFSIKDARNIFLQSSQNLLERQ